MLVDVWTSSRRFLILCAIALVVVPGYAVVLLVFDIAAEPSERYFFPAATTGGQLGVYLEPLAVDAINDSMPFRISFTPNALLRGLRPDSPDRDLVTVVISSDAVEQYVFRAHEKMAPANFTVDLNDGSIRSYPLDSDQSVMSFEFHRSSQQGRLPGARCLVNCETISRKPKS